MLGREGCNWYLVRTKPQRERSVQNQLNNIAKEAFLPLLRARTRCFGRNITTVKPLFLCYLFAYFNLQERLISTIRSGPDKS